MKSNEQLSKMVAFTWYWSMELKLPEWRMAGKKEWMDSGTCTYSARIGRAPST
jgi:hypothetical protein